MQDGCFCLDMENFGCQIFEVPVIHGSRSIVKGFGEWLEEGGKGSMGWKERRNDASLLRCLTVKDIFESLNDVVEDAEEDIGEGHIIIEYWILNGWSLFLQILQPGLVCPE